MQQGSTGCQRSLLFLHRSKQECQKRSSQPPSYECTNGGMNCVFLVPQDHGAVALQRLWRGHSSRKRVIAIMFHKVSDCKYHCSGTNEHVIILCLRYTQNRVR